MNNSPGVRGTLSDARDGVARSGERLDIEAHQGPRVRLASHLEGSLVPLERLDFLLPNLRVVASTISALQRRSGLAGDA